MGVATPFLALFRLLAPVCLLGIGGFATAHAQNAAPPPVTAAMKQEYRRPPPRPIDNQTLVELGRELFFAPQLSASGKTACASCNFRELGWGVLESRSRNDSGKLTSRKSQPLIGLGHAGNAPVGWDGRSATLEAQAKSSIATGSMSMRETPTAVKVEVIEDGSDRTPSMPRSSTPRCGHADQYRFYREGDCRLRADAGARRCALRPLDRRR